MSERPILAVQAGRAKSWTCHAGAGPARSETFVIANGLTVAPRVEVRRGGRGATPSPCHGDLDHEKIWSSLVGVIARQW